MIFDRKPVKVLNNALTIRFKNIFDMDCIDYFCNSFLVK